MMEGLSGGEAERRTLMIDAAYLTAHRTGSSLAVRMGGGRLIGRTQGGMNSKPARPSSNHPEDLVMVRENRRRVSTGLFNRSDYGRPRHFPGAFFGILSRFDATGDYS